MKTKYTNHPLLPLMQLLDGIASAEEFLERRGEILDAIHLAAPILKDRTPECCRLAKDSFHRSYGTTSTPFRMARFVESRIKETLDLGTTKFKPARSCKPSTHKTRLSDHPNRINPIPSMTYSELRTILPTRFSIDSLGGRTEIEFHNPAGGYLMAINSRGNAYRVSESDWNNASMLRTRNPRNPWASKHYSGLSAYTSYGLIHAAALLRHVEEHGFRDIEEVSEKYPEPV